MEKSQTYAGVPGRGAGGFLVRLRWALYSSAMRNRKNRKAQGDIMQKGVPCGEKKI